jgi:WD40 repeat protein
VKLWDLATGRQKASLDTRGLAPRSLAFSPDGKLLAVPTPRSCGISVLEVWDLATDKHRTIHESRTKSFDTVAFSADGKTLASAGHDVQLWDMATGRLKATLRESKFWMGKASLAFSPDGKVLAVGVPGGCPWIELYDTTTGKGVGYFAVAPCDILPLAFSPDGKTLAWAHGHGVALYTVGAGQEPVYREGRARVACLTFSADGRTLHTHRLPTVEVLDLSRGR